ncbi:MAG: hypothetical protein FWD31_01850, partial [Planctomycetaceae bacterium]|nr:hypothetical protein [Planctomycetaceae bacterium]
SSKSRLTMAWFPDCDIVILPLCKSTIIKIRRMSGRFFQDFTLAHKDFPESRPFTLQKNGVPQDIVTDALWQGFSSDCG